MNRGLGAAAKRNRIANYMDSFPEEFEVEEDLLGEENPMIKLQTKSRKITLSCDEKGKVIEEFSMRPGEGSKEDFLTKQEAYLAINGYYNDYYTGAKISKNSFEEGILKIELEDRTVTLSYDFDTKTVEEKDRAKRIKNKPNNSFEQLTIFDIDHTAEEKKGIREVPKIDREEDNKSKEITGKSDVIKQKETIELKEQKELLAQKSIDKSAVNKAKRDNNYKKWDDGTIVVNIFNNKQYKVKHDEGNIIEVFDKEHGYLIMARADLKLI